MAVENTEKAKELIQAWMNDRGFFDPMLSPDPTPKEYHFIVGGKAANEIPFSISLILSHCVASPSDANMLLSPNVARLT